MKNKKLTYEELLKKVEYYETKEKHKDTVFDNFWERIETLILDNLKVGVVACDAKGNLTYFNKTTREFHGLPQENITSEQWTDY